jgi:glycosyltransferase involved in cell wall biosynthesis
VKQGTPQTHRSLQVVFIDQVGRIPGGAEQTLATFLRHLPSDIKPVVVLFEDGDFADQLRLTGAQVRIVEAPASISLSTRERSSPSAAFQSGIMILKLANLLIKERAEVVYTNSMKAHIIGSLAARLVGIPTVMHFHDIFEGRPLLVLRLLARLNSKTRIACSRLVANSMNIEQTRVIYSPIEYASYEPVLRKPAARAGLGIKDELPVVALVGRINRWKGHDRFIRIAGLVNAIMPARFAIVGAAIFRDTEFVSELVQLTAELGLTERVTFHPWVADVRNIFSAVDINVNCSTREPFGRTVIEAGATGVPSVCFRDSGASEIISDGVTGRLVDAGDEAEFAQAIVELLTNRGMLERIGVAARGAMKRFDAHTIAIEMGAAIRDAVDRPRSRNGPNGRRG